MHGETLKYGLYNLSYYIRLVLIESQKKKSALMRLILVVLVLYRIVSNHFISDPSSDYILIISKML